MRLKIFICLLLAGVTLAIYWPARHYGMVDFDDPLFVTDDEEITSGLTWHSLWWALSGVLVANWHPVTSLSFLLTHQWLGINPGAEHLVNMIFHAVNAALLFLVLERLTKAPGRSAVVAAIFAWHPLRVESVAWIAERKDVLCGFFFLLTLFWYAKAVTSDKWRVARTETGAAPDSSQATRHPALCYWLALVCYVLALMSKPMAVTLPFVLLLLDVWPLGRVASDKWRVTRFRIPVPQPSTFNHLLFEKWPFFALTAFFCALTFWIQQTHAAVVPFGNLGFGARLENATLSYVNYLGNFFCPTKLAVFYPYPKSFDGREPWLAALLLLAISIFCLLQLSRRPYLFTGWFWFLIALGPVIGLVQVGSAAMADRYTYISLIGPAISLVWWATDWAEAHWFRRFLLVPLAILLLGACAIATRRQLEFWRNSVSLFEHTVAVTTENAFAQFGLAGGLEHEGRLQEAMRHYFIEEAIAPEDYRTHYSVGDCFRMQGRWQLALREYNAAVSAGINADKGIAHLDVAASLAIADVLLHLGREREAADQLEAALRMKPEATEVLNNLAWLLATCPDASIRDGARAVSLAERACQLTDYKTTIIVGTLAAAYAEAGRFDDAMATAERAIALAEKNHEPELVQKNRELLELYRAHRAYHETLNR
jgi:hypothetical protein